MKPPEPLSWRAEAITCSQTCEVTAEAVCFPAAAQAAVLRREVSHRQPETVYLLEQRADRAPQRQGLA